MNIKINKERKLVAVVFPPTKRNIVFIRYDESIAYYLSFPEHMFVFPIRPIGPNKITLTGDYPFKFVLIKYNKYYDAPISTANRNGQGGVCISLGHESIRGEVEEAIKTCIDKFWTTAYWSREGPYVKENYAYGDLVHLPEFEESSIKELKSFVKEIDEKLNKNK